jgi:hypothetical protein
MMIVVKKTMVVSLFLMSTLPRVSKVDCLNAHFQISNPGWGEGRGECGGGVGV